MGNSLPLAFGTNLRRIGGFPEFLTENLLVENTPSNQDKGVALVGRPGLATYATVGQGPLRCISGTSGVFNDDTFVLSGFNLSRISTASVVTAITGTIPGGERVSFAAGFDESENSEGRIACEAGIYLTDGVTVSAEVFPLDGGVSSVAYVRGFWFAVAAATGEIYTRIPGDLVWDTLTFTTAEYKPDKALGVFPVGDQIFVPGAASTEVFGLTGDSTNPLVQYTGLAWTIGCRARDSVAVVGDSLYLVSTDCGVYRFSPQPTLVSDPGLSEQLRNAEPNTLRAWSYRLDGKLFYILTCSEGTWMHDGQVWTKASSKGYNYWRAALGSQVGDAVLAADSIAGSGQIWKLDPFKLTDNGDEITRTATAWMEIKQGYLPIANLQVNCAVGLAPRTGQGSDPLVSIRCSRDGQTWEAWRECSLGASGQFSTKVKINRWGVFKAPGALFQVRVSDPTLVRITDVMANVP